MFRFWIIACMLVGIVADLHAQTRGVYAPPNTLMQVFEDHFPDAENISWKKDASGYEVVFFNHKLKMIARYAISEIWEHTDIEVPVDMMPAQTMDHFRKNFPGATQVKTGYHDSPEARYYKIDMVIDGKRRQLRYDDNGDFIR
ncbi:MAG: hypothetical protein SF052_04905 [Bacteroidia bacterium]|nr:hypothetical protein [Bacteroidia bacterium]